MCSCLEKTKGVGGANNCLNNGIGCVEHSVGTVGGRQLLQGGWGPVGVATGPSVVTDGVVT
jgi:hypothetical protein